MKIIVISVTQYKEKDGIINAISHEGVISFLARGILDPKNKFAPLNNYLTIADVELTESNAKYPSLKNYSILATPVQVDSNLDYLASVMLLAESTKCLLQDEEKAAMFQWLEKAILEMKNSKNYIGIDLIYLSNILKLSGYEFEVNRCVFCGSKKNIVAFSFNDGGFVCGNCLNEMEDIKRDLNPQQMLLLRYIFNTESYDIPDELNNRDNELTILHKLSEFISDSFGIKLSSINLIRQ